ncbi:tRNA-splicing endonuclease subunit sen54 [Dimargaris xerosporica]|nr:tRNA-splicing endonuclease subunit sen54 [Dimargaris xerosporica]
MGRQASVAAWFPDDGVALVLVAKGHLMRTAGFTWQGQLWLLPEEALFEVERGTLLLWLAPTGTWQGPDFDATRATAELEALALPTCYQLLVDNDSSTGLGLAVYHTYAYLRRLGYTVLRSPIYHHHRRTKARREGTLMLHSSKPAMVTIFPAWFGVKAAVLLLRRIKLAAILTCTWFFGWFDRWWNGLSRLRTSSALIPPVALKDWASESLPLALDAPQSLADFSRTANWHYCVYRPSTGFSKRKIPEADYRVFVQK